LVRKVERVDGDYRDDCKGEKTMTREEEEEEKV